MADREVVHAALGTLGRRRRREALVLRYFLGFSLEDLAEHLGCSRNAASSLTSRALADPRDELGRDICDD